jgi:hypothetical protein
MLEERQDAVAHAEEFWHNCRRRADVILVDGNPLDDVTMASRRIGLMIKGRWLPQSELEKTLDELVSRYQTDK